MEFERETVEILDGSEEELLVIPLSGGRVVHAREVPIHLWADIHAANPRPEEPVDEVETAAGTTELVRPKPDDPRWIRYYIEIDEYTDKISRIIQRVRWYYAFKGVIEVPEDWEGHSVDDPLEDTESYGNCLAGVNSTRSQRRRSA